MARIGYVLAIGCLAFASATAAAAGRADGGPSPGVSNGWDGVLAPGGKERYVALAAGSRTVVAAVAVNGGRVLRFSSLRGGYGIPTVAFDGTGGGLSHDGSVLTLASYPGGGPQAVTRFAFLGTKGFRVRSKLSLRGSFSFDAFSPDMSTLYLIQYLGQNGSRYAVRAYDLRARRLVARAIADRRTKQREMAGSPLARATAIDGRWVYTLYAGGRHPFVHALDTVAREAVCVDLPWHRAQNALWRMELVLDRGEKHLVVRWRVGSKKPVFRIDTRTFKVSKRLDS